MTTARIIFSMILCGLLQSTFAVEQPAMVKKVINGELKEAKASWWGFDPEDSTSALQNAINSRVPKLIVDNVGKTWITNKLTAVSNQEIVFEKGVVVEAKRGEFKSKTATLFTISGKENVTLRGGEGVILRMHRADYDNPELYEKAEWRHALAIFSSKNINIFGLTLALSGGDGIYLGVSKEGVTNENIHIKNVVCDQNYRQGISVISAKNLLIEDSIMKNTGGTPPAAGIDFEPNRPSEQLVNCVMRNCLTENNEGIGFDYYLPNLHADSVPASLRLENCISRGDRTSFSLTTANSEAEMLHGKFDIVHCRFEKARMNAIKIGRKPVNGLSVRFRDCVVVSPGVENKRMIPLVVTAVAGGKQAIGGVDFGNLTLLDDVDRPFLDYYDCFGIGGNITVKGTIVLQRQGRKETYKLTPEWMQKNFPQVLTENIPALSLEGKTFIPAEMSGVPAASLSYSLRSQGTLAVWAAAGEVVDLTLEYAQVGNYGGSFMKLKGLSPTGKNVKLDKIPFKETKTVRFTAAETGLYQMGLNIGSNRCVVLGSSKPVALSGVDKAIHFITAAGDFYFLVPAGTKRFGLLFYGDGTSEGIRATIFNAAGEQIWDQDEITRPKMFAYEKVTEKDEVWKVLLRKPTGIVCEDNYVDFRGIPPFFARDPRALLRVVPKKN
ncbi:MAG: right-handed parallel beta-helix repeat-containing protein [Lentisphaeria bacterium]